MQITCFTDGTFYYKKTPDFTINHKNVLVDIDVTAMKKVSKHKFSEERNRWFRDHTYEWKYKGNLYRTNDLPIEFVDIDILFKNHNAQEFKKLCWVADAALVVHNGKLYLAHCIPWQDRIVLSNKAGEVVKSVTLQNCKNYHKVR